MKLDTTHQGALITCTANNSKIKKPTTISKKAIIAKHSPDRRPQTQDLQHTNHNDKSQMDNLTKTSILCAGTIATILTLTMTTWMRSKIHRHQGTPMEEEAKTLKLGQRHNPDILPMLVTTV